jgi:uncharacterized membrane protein YhaH (DUF805 family)
MNNLLVLFSFKGRIRRMQYWLGSLIVFGLGIAMVFVGSLIVMLTLGAPRTLPAGGSIAIAGVMFAAWGMMLWGYLALGVKRLHDRNSSGWLLLLYFVPFVNLALVFMLAFMDGTQGPNRYGPSPKGIGGRYGDRELGAVFS